jgi:hypothetical protein
MNKVRHETAYLGLGLASRTFLSAIETIATALISPVEIKLSTYPGNSC